MNILYISDLSGMGGGEVSLLHTMSEMSKKHKVYLLCRVPGTLVDKSREIGITVYCYDFKRDLLKSLNKFRKIIKSNNIDVVHSNELTTSILHGIQLQLILYKRVKNVCTCHGQWYELSKTKRLLINKYIKHIFCVSKAVNNNISKQQIKNTSVSYLGVPESRFEVSPDRVEKLRKELAIDDCMKIIITVARFQKIKGQLKGVQAIEKIYEHTPNLVYLLIGDNIFGSDADAEYKKMVENYVINHNMEKYIRFLGERNDIPELMALSDFIMITSDNESFGMVAIEAIAAGRIIVSTPCDGVCEILENDPLMISRSNDAEGLYKILENELVDDDIHYKSIDKICSLKRKFSVDEVCKKYLAQY